MSQSSASNFSPTSISVGKENLKIVLTFFWTAEVRNFLWDLNFKAS